MRVVYTERVVEHYACEDKIWRGNPLCNLKAASRMKSGEIINMLRVIPALLLRGSHT